ncbi:carbohydate-binding domain-containing protein [Pseudoalteromonas sp. C2R02]|uniref:family 20 glycosylhydrolase n=1 Tax=Pseudoalteromonas sp. C2R02 TaxID=2841565 RepID=UPI001C09F7A5|nr:family 20 glycosylhydrolase [Pseudoalteromonas sp. C2R02]MBU2969136.1 carbohydate-binding domain-containing protein [Pseudoalteromonas sp. C2R02]
MRYFSMLALFCLLVACQGIEKTTPFTQQNLNDFSSSVKVKYGLLNSLPKLCPNDLQQCYYSKIEITLPYDLKGNNWEIYFSQLTPVIADESQYFDIIHINGDLQKLVPTPLFNGFKSDDTQEVTFYSSGSQISRSEFMPNFIANYKGLEAKIIESTKTGIDPDSGLETQPYLLPFTDKTKQFKLSKNDKTVWASSQALYLSTPEIHENIDISAQLIPKPKNLQVDVSFDVLDLSLGVNFALTGLSDSDIQAAISRLKFLGIPQNKKGVAIKLSVNKSLKSDPEGYQLSANKEGIEIKASHPTGIFYGLMSVSGLVSTDNLTIPFLTIEDAPRYDFRGLHIDVARNFRSKAFILKTLDQMAAYKLNKLHLHLADDEGWRLEIEGLEELTSIGAKRCFDLSEQSCLLPQLGVGVTGNSHLDGFYSKQDYLDILAYAKHRHIQVIPSLDMPGHSRAAVVSMQARYQKYISTDKNKAEQYWLTEPEDKTQYASIQHYNDNTLNVCLDSTYNFIDKVITEVQKLHKKSGMPLSIYHIGADETAGAWVKSPACIALKKTEGDVLKGLHTLNGYFIEKVANMLDKKGIQVAGWNDGMGETRPEKMPENVQTNSWALLFEEGHKVTHNQANLEWQTVLSTPEVTYFDFPYEAHPKERGNHWAARNIDSRKVFEFMPDNLPAHAQIWTDVKNQSYQANDSRSKLDSGVKFKGIQAHLWSEMIRSDQQAEYMLFPRLLAFSERAWHKPGWELDYNYQGIHFDKSSEYFSEEAKRLREVDWQRFASIVGKKELAKLEMANIFYRIPSVATKVDEGKLSTKTLYPNLPIEFKNKQGVWQALSSEEKSENIKAIRAVSVLGSRKGRSLNL